MYKSSLILLILFCSTLCLAQQSSVQYYIEESELKLEKEDYKGALETINLGILTLPDSAKLYEFRGVLYSYFLMYEEAILDFTSALERTNNNLYKSHLLTNRGGSKQKIRDFNGAYYDLLVAITLDSTNLDALNNMATACDELNRPDETFFYLNKIIQIDSNYTYAYINLGFKYQTLGEHEKALTYFNKAIDLNPEEPLGYSNRSFSKLKTNDIVGAMEDIQYSIELFPTNSYAYKILALILIEEQNFEDACTNLDLANNLKYTEHYGDEVNTVKEKYCN